MYRIRLHGRGGQGMKTAGRILGTAFFLEGFEVQDAPRYGAERRGAPIFAYVRAARNLIYERGVIRRPDLVLVADDTLVASPAAGVLSGVTEQTVLLISSAKKPKTWQERLNFPGPVLTLPAAELTDPRAIRFIGAACTGAAARLVGVISRDSLAQAVRDELAPLGEAIVGKNRDQALEAYDLMAPHAGCVTEKLEHPAADTYERPQWIQLPFEDAGLAAPVIPAAATSEEVKTGLWRTVRPVIDYQRCRRCAWICSTFCPEGNISLNQEGYPEIDYEHCKGCLICLAQCPRHAIRAVPEREIIAEAEEGVRS
ncbi:MAG: 2-oxoacid:acceptor oxidoreductase family protein [Deltaproteobacteria bacterium]|nr:2-oxoacid:acceptor oxidoreductase family protein [Deltaproteobacteria bacterium]